MAHSGRRDPALVYADRQVAAIRLANCRLRRFKRQEDAAEALGRPQSFVSALETGQRRLDIVELLEVAEVYGVDPAVVIGPPKDGAERLLHAEFVAAYRAAVRAGSPAPRPRGAYRPRAHPGGDGAGRPEDDDRPQRRRA